MARVGRSTAALRLLALTALLGGGARAQPLVDGGSIITTVAGNGLGGFSGDRGPGTSTTLWFPSGVAVDGGGNVLIADEQNHCIRRLAAGTGVITTVSSGLFLKFLMNFLVPLDSVFYGGSNGRT